MVVTPCGFDSLSGHQNINYRKGSGHLLNFCSHCGAPVTSKIPEGDHLLRFVLFGDASDGEHGFRITALQVRDPQPQPLAGDEKRLARLAAGLPDRHPGNRPRILGARS